MPVSPHLVAAADGVVPLSLDGGTRLEIVEAMATGKALFSTMLVPRGSRPSRRRGGGDLPVEDQPAAFADAVNRLLAEPDLTVRIGQSARQLAADPYAWSRAGGLRTLYARSGS